MYKVYATENRDVLGSLSLRIQSRHPFGTNQTLSRVLDKADIFAMKLATALFDGNCIDCTH